MGEGPGSFAGDEPESVLSNGAGENQDDGELMPDEDDQGGRIVSRHTRGKKGGKDKC